MFAKRSTRSVKKQPMLALVALLLLAVAIGAFVTVDTAVAADRVTRGDVESWFHAWNNGRVAVSTTGAGTSGQFEARLDDAAILPFFSPAITDLRYCVEDYHLIMLAWFNGSREEMSDFGDEFTQTFIIDGQVLETRRTPLARRIPSGFGFNEGAILAPGELGVGSHTLEYEGTHPEFPGGAITDSFTFYVDAAGTGACERS